MKAKSPTPKLLLGICLLALVTCWSVLSAAEPQEARDVIMIMGVVPDTVTSGEEVEIAVRVAYALVSADSGVIRLGANIHSPTGDRSIASLAVKKGTGEVTIRAKILPRYWSDTVPLGVSAALLVATGDTLLTKALSIDRANFHVKPATKENPAGPWPAVSATYVDGVSVVSISPETFSEGNEQEIVVKVKYELLSREEGEITLSASYGSLTVRRQIGRTRVKIGKGEAEIRARFVPSKTAGFPVGRLLISLSEFPRGRQSRALAWDEASIEVK